jgi:16S rRNA (guanine527-N7)-methyltransferase
MLGGLSPDRHEALFEVLEDARRLGYLGPGHLEGHVLHALACGDVLARVLAQAPCEETRAVAVIDLGSGAGLPGLVLGLQWPTLGLTLLEAQDRRVAFLRSALPRLGLGDRVEVVRARAEDLGRTPARRSGFRAAVARSFGPPAVTAECAAPFLEQGGLLVVSEPPEGSAGRWPAEGLARLGMRYAGAEGGEFHFAVLEQVLPCPDRFPRRSGVPAKRPLF